MGLSFLDLNTKKSEIKCVWGVCVCLHTCMCVLFCLMGHLILTEIFEKAFS